MELEPYYAPILFLGKVTDYSECPRKAMHVHQDWVITKEDKPYLVFGIRFHKAAEMLLGHGLEIALEYIETEVLNPDDRFMLKTLLYKLAQECNLQDITEIISLEKTYLLDLTPFNSPIFHSWAIKPDALIRTKDGLFVWEYKTTSSYGASTQRYYHSSMQTKSYYTILKMLFPEIQGTTLFVGTKGTKKDGPMMYREDIRLTSKDMLDAQEFIQTSIDTITQIVQEDNHYKNYLSCIKAIFGECPYIPLCTEKNPEYLKMLKETWFKLQDPLEHLNLTKEDVWRG